MCFCFPNLSVSLVHCAAYNVTINVLMFCVIFFICIGKQFLFNGRIVVKVYKRVVVKVHKRVAVVLIRYMI